MTTYLLPNSNSRKKTDGDIYSGAGQLGKTVFVDSLISNITQSYPNFGNRIYYRYFLEPTLPGLTFTLSKIGTIIEPGYNCFIYNVSSTNSIDINEDSGMTLSTIPANGFAMFSAKSAGIPDIWLFSNDTAGPVEGNFLYVDSVYGITGTRNRLDEQYPTLQAADADAIAGDVVLVRPGSYTVDTTLTTLGVDYYFAPGCLVNVTAASLFTSGASAGDDNNVYGYGEFSGGANLYTSTTSAGIFEAVSSNLVHSYDNITTGEDVFIDIIDASGTITLGTSFTQRCILRITRCTGALSLSNGDIEATIAVVDADITLGTSINSIALRIGTLDASNSFTITTNSSADMDIIIDSVIDGAGNLIDVSGTADMSIRIAAFTTTQLTILNYTGDGIVNLYLDSVGSTSVGGNAFIFSGTGSVNVEFNTLNFEFSSLFTMNDTTDVRLNGNYIISDGFTKALVPGTPNYLTINVHTFELPSGTITLGGATYIYLDWTNLISTSVGATPIFDITGAGTSSISVNVDFIDVVRPIATMVSNNITFIFKNATTTSTSYAFECFESTNTKIFGKTLNATSSTNAILIDSPTGTQRIHIDNIYSDEECISYTAVGGTNIDTYLFGKEYLTNDTTVPCIDFNDTTGTANINNITIGGRILTQGDAAVSPIRINATNNINGSLRLIRVSSINLGAASLPGVVYTGSGTLTTELQGRACARAAFTGTTNIGTLDINTAFR